LNSIHLGRAFGIDIRMHSLFVLMMLFYTIAFGVGVLPYLTMLFGLVLLHELGHSLVAQRFGIRVLDITFWPLGGMARMSHIPEDSRIEGLIAIAGPAVNLALVLLALPLLWLTDGLGAGTPWMAGMAKAFIMMNLALGLFNLVPAFPMDGGRILRAWLGRRGDWVSATEIAVRVGRYVALAMCIIGVFSRPMILALPLIGIFIWWTGIRELWSVRLRHGIGPMMDQMMGQGAAGEQQGAPDIFAFFRQAAQAQAQGRPRVEDSAPPSSDGFSDDDIERLERFRGPMDRPE
jgi:Zn-dependent protease